MFKVLVTDSLAEEGLAVLEQAAGIDLVNKPGMSPRELLVAVQNAAGLIVRSGTEVTAEVIQAASDLRIIGRAGIGVDNVDVAAATKRGIVVANTPEGNSVTTAEHAIALLLSLARHIPRATASMKAGEWNRKEFQGIELFNRTLGIIGLGKVGRVVADRAQGLGMRVLAYDPLIAGEVARKLDVELVDLDELLERSDALTVHVPRTKETAGLLGHEALRKTKRGALLVNAARGGIVDEDALLEALESGRVASAALDVFVDEPPKSDHPLVRHERVICTPHLGASTEQAQINVATLVAGQICDYLLNGIVRNAVNVPSLSPELLEQARPYLTLGEKLGRFQGQLIGGSVDEIEVEYSGEVSEFDVAPITIAILKGLIEPMTEGVNMVNAPILAKEFGIRVVESKSSTVKDFTSMISTRVRGPGKRDLLIAGAIFHGGQPRIVRINDLMLEAIPEGPTILVNNLDRPGVVGSVGRVLGDAGVNISRMQLGLVAETGAAAMLVNVEPAPSDDVMQNLRDIPAVVDAELVDLGP